MAQAATDLPVIRVKPGASSLKIGFPDSWLNDNPLTYADSEQEAKYLKGAGFKLDVA